VMSIAGYAQNRIALTTAFVIGISC